jgi:pyruvate formate lyase activating enzyme
VRAASASGEAELPFYGHVTALARDPIEKKPLYHWRPGSFILSAGFAGCNLRCPFCQNWHISQSTDTPGRILTPEELTALAAEDGALAYTYSEPLVHAEFLLRCMEEARKAGIANVLVSNGCVNAEAASLLLPLTDAANIDLKCFSKKTYKEILGGDLDTVLGFIEKAVGLGVHIELTTLVVPGLNDSKEELDAAADYIAGLSPEIPWHLSAYHPDWQWDAPPTDPRQLIAAARNARRRLSNVHLGNVRCAD